MKKKEKEVKLSYINKMKVTLEEMHSLKTFSGADVCRKHEINTMIPQILVDMGFAKYSGLNDGRFFWTGKAPTDKMAIDIILKARDVANKSADKRKDKLIEGLREQVKQELYDEIREQVLIDVDNLRSKDIVVPTDIQNPIIKEVVLSNPDHHYTKEEIDMMAIFAKNSGRYKVYRVVIKEDLEEI